MEFIGIKELSQRTSALVRKKDWVVITKNGKPVKLMMEIDADDLEDLILAKHYQLEKEFRRSVRDLQKGKLKDLTQILSETRRRAS